AASIATTSLMEAAGRRLRISEIGMENPPEYSPRMKRFGHFRHVRANVERLYALPLRALTYLMNQDQQLEISTRQFVTSIRNPQFTTAIGILNISMPLIVIEDGCYKLASADL